MSGRKTFLVISDTHINKTHEAVWLERFGQWASRLQPDVLVFLGDLADFDCKARYIKERSGDLPEEEVEYAVSQLDKYIFDVISNSKAKKRKDKKKIWRPTTVFCMGNHDERVEDLLLPELTKRFDIVCKNREHVCLSGVSFAHTFDKGISGTTCSDAKDVLMNTMCCTVSGHSHVRSWAELKRPDGSPVFAIKMPCATQAYPEWAGHKGNAWNRGFLVLNVGDILGTPFMYDFEFVGD
jgi:predicted phosphodiesterase